MDDAKIVDLYWSRSEQAISETEAKYGRYCRTISYSLTMQAAKHKTRSRISGSVLLIFWGRVELLLNYTGKRKNIFAQKVMKKTVFLLKTVFLVVAGEGFEPTTSGL